MDSAGRTTVTGSTISNNFPTSAGAFDRTYAGGTCGTLPNTYPCSDMFVTRLSANASALVYSTYLGGGGADRSLRHRIGCHGQHIRNRRDPLLDFPTTPGAFDRSFNGSGRFYDDGFVTRLNASGSALVYNTYLGGTTGDVSRSIAVDSMRPGHGGRHHGLERLPLYA